MLLLELEEVEALEAFLFIPHPLREDGFVLGVAELFEQLLLRGGRLGNADAQGEVEMPDVVRAQMGEEGAQGGDDEREAREVFEALHVGDEGAGDGVGVDVAQSWWPRRSLTKAVPYLPIQCSSDWRMPIS